MLAISLAPARAGAAAADLELIEKQRLGSRLQELTFRTPALAAPTKVRVLTPRGYRARPHRRYPVLYLLHGAIDDYRAWTDKGNAAGLTADYPLIVVMPDGGQAGFYSDWFNGGEGGPPMWETYHLRQLMPWIGRHYRNRPGRGGRAIAGLSMGGFGALSYAARHPDRFVAAASFSGAVDTNQLYGLDPALLETAFGGAAPGSSVWGPRLTQETRWRGHNPWDLAENLRDLDLTLRTGNGLPGGPYGGGDPIEIFIHSQNVSLHDRLAELGVAHLWDDYGAGGHSWPYWERDLRLTLPDLRASFRRRAGRPSHFAYTAVEPRYSIYGWRVSFAREAELEFSRLENARRRGFRLTGSGEARVETPPRFGPGTRWTAIRRSASGVDRVRVRASARGRLAIDVPLGGTEAEPGVVRVRIKRR